MDDGLAADWADDAERLLFDGETVTHRLERDEGAVVVTSHRVLAFTPDATGENYRAVDRPNVEDVSRHSGGNRAYLRRALTPGLVGIGLLAAAALVDVESYAPTVEDAGIEPGTPGAGSVRSTLETVGTLFAMLDALVLACGLIATLAAAAFLGLYLRSRERALVIAVAGEADLELPPGTDADGEIEALTRAIVPKSTDGSAGEASPTPESAAGSDRSTAIDPVAAVRVSGDSGGTDVDVTADAGGAADADADTDASAVPDDAAVETPFGGGRGADDDAATDRAGVEDRSDDRDDR